MRGLGLIALTITSAGALAGQDRARLREPVAPDPTVTIEFMTGEIHVRAWDRDEIEVGGPSRDAVRLDVSDRGRRIEIDIDLSGRRAGRRVRSGPIDLTVRVPRASNVNVESMAGSIDLSGMTGRVVAETMSGTIRIEGASESVTAATLSGSIDIDGARDVEAETTSGPLDVRDVSGSIELESTSGSITISGQRVTRARVEAFSGSIAFEATIDPAGRYAFETHSGSVTLVLPGEISATFDVRTGHGAIQNDFGANGERRSRFGPGREARFVVGDGRADVTVETFNGDIRLRRR